VAIKVKYALKFQEYLLVVHVFKPFNFFFFCTATNPAPAY